MDKFVIDGPARLEGEVAVSGAKNAALPCLAATLLTAEAVRLTNLPRVADVRTMQKVLGHVGARVEAEPEAVTVNAAFCPAITVWLCGGTSSAGGNKGRGVTSAHEKPNRNSSH